MLKKPSLLIVTSKTGGGHVSLAEALRDMLSSRYSVEIVDPQPALIQFHYRFVSRYALHLWAAEFHHTDNPQRALLAHKFFARIMRRRLQALFQRSQPALILTTYPFLTYEVMQALPRTDHPPFAMLFSDPNGVHASWLTERRATATLATTQETYTQALNAGFTPERVHMVGWPVRNQFLHASSQQRSELLSRIGLDSQRFTIFLQGGGEGAARFTRTVENVLAIGPELQVILATGTNKALRTRFSNIPNLYPLPFTREIAQYMAAADVIMGKAGPNTLLEAVTLQKPFIATAYIPGQEEANLEFIQRHRLGWVALHPAEQQQLLHRLLAQPALLQEMSSSVEAYCSWNLEANQQIPAIVDDLVGLQSAQTGSEQKYTGPSDAPEKPRKRERRSVAASEGI